MDSTNWSPWVIRLKKKKDTKLKGKEVGGVVWEEIEELGELDQQHS